MVIWVKIIPMPQTDATSIVLFMHIKKHGPHHNLSDVSVKYKLRHLDGAVELGSYSITNISSDINHSIKAAVSLVNNKIQTTK